MRIGIWCPYDLSRPGGVQAHALGLAEGLRAHGDDVTLLAPCTQPVDREPMVRLHPIGRARPFPVNGSVAAISLAPCTAAIEALLACGRFDVIHLHEPFASPTSCNMLRLASATRAGVVATFHAYAQRNPAYALARPLLERLLRGVHGRLAVSEPARDFVARYFPGTYRIIPNGVDVHRFHPNVPPSPQLLDGKPTGLFLSRFEPRKGAEELLRAIPLIRERFPATRFVFAGDGALRLACEQLVAEQGWADVVFTGRVPECKKPALYAAAHVYCAPNTGGESQGVTLLEALASGRPVVASAIPGFCSVIRHGHEGLLVSPQRPDELARAVIAVLGDAALARRLGAAGRARALEYSWEHVCAQTRAYYQEVRQESLGVQEGRAELADHLAGRARQTA
jgi:phosphatidyl-myo-inositol alpha-mannosyltransferase